MAVQPDGKIVVASHDWEHAVFLLRYNENGSLDQSFGSGGVATYILAGTGHQINGKLSIARQEDGKLVLGSYYYVENTNMSRLFALRFMQDGDIDVSCGDNGMAINDTTTFDFGSGCTSPSGEPYASYVGGAVMIDHEGRILQTGTRTAVCDFDYPQQFYATRYLEDGFVDPAFSPVSGGLFTTYCNSEVAGSHLVMDSFPMLFGHGIGHGDDSAREVPKMMFLQPNGEGGLSIAYSMKIANPAIEYFKVSAMVQADSGYLIAGTIRENGRDKFAVTKVRRGLSTSLPYLAIDSSYGTDGVAAIDLSPTHCQLKTALGLSGGKVLLGGSAETNPISGSDMVMVRLNEDGTLDQGFANGGILRKDHDSGADYLFSLKAAPDGKMVAMGATDKNFESYVVLMRYSDGLTSITPTEQKILVEAFPNPSANEVAFRFEKPFSGTMTVTDAKGRRVEHREIVASEIHSLNIQAYPDGIYAVRFGDGCVSLTCKFIKGQ